MTLQHPDAGGHEAFVVLADADLDRTLHSALWGALDDRGPCGVAARRIVLVEAVAERFLARFTAALMGLGSHAAAPATACRTLALPSEAALRETLSACSRTVAQGAQQRLGGARDPGGACHLQPTLLTDIGPDNLAYRQAIAGPVALCFCVRGDDEAVDLVNDPAFGLGATLYTRDTTRGRHLAARIDTGLVFINDPGWATTRAGQATAYRGLSIFGASGAGTPVLAIEARL